MCSRREVVNKEAQLLSRSQLLGGFHRELAAAKADPRGRVPREMVPFFIPTGSLFWIQGRSIWMPSWGVQMSPEIDPGCPGNCIGPEMMKGVSSLGDTVRVPV